MYVLRHLTVDSRQVDLENRPFSQFAVNPDVSAALLYDAIDRGEPESRTLPELLGGKKWIKNLRLRLTVHTAAGIRNANHYVGAGDGGRMLLLVGFIELSIGELDGQTATIGHGVSR